MHTIKKTRKYKYRTRRNNNKKHSRKFIQKGGKKQTISNRKLNRNRRQTKKKDKKHMEGGWGQFDEQPDTTLPKDFCEKINKMIEINRGNKIYDKKKYDKTNDKIIREIKDYKNEFKKNIKKNPELMNKMNELCRYTPLITAILYKNIDIVKFLLTYGKIEIDVNIGNPLFHAVGNNEVEMVKLLLGHPSIRIEESGSITPLRMAVINRFEDIVKLLLDHYCKDLEKKTEKDIIMYREDINYNIRMVSKLISEYNGEEDIITIYMRIDNLLKEALSKIDVVYSANPVKDMPAILEEVTPAGLQEVTPAGLQEVTPAGLEEDTGNPPPVDDE
jgi:hypothetical protein